MRIAVGPTRFSLRPIEVTCQADLSTSESAHDSNNDKADNLEDGGGLAKLLSEHGVQCENDYHKEEPIAQIDKDGHRDLPVVVTVIAGGSALL